MPRNTSSATTRASHVIRIAMPSGRVVFAQGELNQAKATALVKAANRRRSQRLRREALESAERAS